MTDTSDKNNGIHLLSMCMLQTHGRFVNPVLEHLIYKNHPKKIRIQEQDSLYIKVNNSIIEKL